MKIDRKQFAAALKAAKTAQGTKESEGILIEAASGQLEVTGYNPAETVTATLPCSFAEEFKILVPAAVVPAVEKMESGEIDIEAGEGTVTVKGGRSQYQFALLDAELYPSLPDIGESAAVKVGNIQRLINRASYAAGSDWSRPALRGVLIEPGDVLTVTACDGYRMARAWEETENGEPRSAVIPADSLNKIRGYLGEDCVLRIGKTFAAFESGNVRAAVRLISEAYPDYRKMFRESSPVTARVAVDSLRRAVESVKITVDSAPGKVPAPIQCKIGDGRWELSVRTSMGAASCFCSCETDGEMELGLNADYLYETLKHIGADELAFGFESPKTAVTVTGGNADAVIMPVRG